MEKKKYKYRLMCPGLRTKARITGQLHDVFHEDKDGNRVLGWRAPFYSEEKFIYAINLEDAERMLDEMISYSGKWNGYTVPVLVPNGYGHK